MHLRHLAAAPGAPKPAEITARWTFAGTWDPERSDPPRVVGQRPIEGVIELTWSERVTVKGRPRLRLPPALGRRHGGFMFSPALLRSSLLVCPVLCVALLAQAPRRPLEPRDFDAWRSIATPQLSRDGRWLAYSFMPQDADGDLVVRDRHGQWTYQFAVVVDDWRDGIDWIIRGASFCTWSCRCSRPKDKRMGCQSSVVSC